jgi:hypothetical protein
VKVVALSCGEVLALLLIHFGPSGATAGVAGAVEVASSACNKWRLCARGAIGATFPTCFALTAAPRQNGVGIRAVQVKAQVLSIAPALAV